MKKRIAVLSSHTPSLFWFRMEMMIEFEKKGYEVYALANEAEEKWSKKFQAQGITYLRIDVKRNGVNPLQDRKTLRSIEEKLEYIKPEKVFTFQAKTIIYGAIAANRVGISEVYPLIGGMGSMFITDNYKSRIIRRVMIALYRNAMKNCPAVFFQNHDDEQIFRNCGIIKGQKVVLIHGSGVNTEKFGVSPLPSNPAFLCISRLIKDKGVYEYLEACMKIKEQYRDVRCMLVGPYDTNPSALKPEELKPFVDVGIEYFGEQEDVRPYIEQSSVFVLPSYREGTPKTNLEAMSCGRPVITTDAPGCRETVVNEKNGFLVPIKNVDEIYEKMKWFIDNPDRIQDMGLEGRRMVEELFDVNKVNEEICKTMKL